MVDTITTRQIFLDTETTGMNKFDIHYKGHRIIEIGAVEIINRRLTGKYFHVYLKPERPVDPDALNIHGITDEFLLNKPTFADIADEFLNFIRNSELIIHNASFDIGFIDHEFTMLNRGIAKTNTICKITDSLLIARKIFPGKRNSLDALCSRYMINNRKRSLHSALVDAKILADVYLLMTSGQTTISFTQSEKNQKISTFDNSVIHRFRLLEKSLKVICANNEEIYSHEQYLDTLQKSSGSCLWRQFRG